MCGISGILTSGEIGQYDAVARSMGELQTHRGPDNLGILTLANSTQIHNRLSIIDLSEHGNQPMVHNDHVLCFNGEIYNYLDLRHDLENRGVQFKGASDSEVLLHSLILDGVEITLKRIRGMFAFSFYNKSTDILYLARDRFGIKPLHWYHRGNSFFWASEAKTIALPLGIGLNPTHALAGVFGVAEISREVTVFKDIRHVPPGCYLKVGVGKSPEIFEYYNYNDVISEQSLQRWNRASSTEVYHYFAELLRSSVKRMLMSDVPMGIFVSGGIDSSIIATLAAELNPSLQLFTANVIGDYSELKEAELLSKTIHLPIYKIDFSPDMLDSEYVRTTYYYENMIVRHINALPMQHVARLAREHGVKPVLTGEGSDELFVGYDSPYLSLEKQVLNLPFHLVRSLLRRVPLTVFRHAFTENRDDEMNLLYQLYCGHESSAIKKEVERKLKLFSAGRIQREFTTWNTNAMSTHLVGLLHRNDRMGMMHSIESRFPFLDEDLIEFGLNLPVRYKAHMIWRYFNSKHPFIQDKHIVRHLGKGILPKVLYWKKKWGFSARSKGLAAGPEYFKNGYVENELGISYQRLSAIQSTAVQQNMIAVETMGQLFHYRRNIEETEEKYSISMRKET